MKHNSARGALWDLKELYWDQDDPSLLKDMMKARERAGKFAGSYKGRLGNDLDGETLLAALREYEQIHEMGMRPYFFATLLFSAQTQDHERKERLDEIRGRWNEILRLLMFFRLEIMALPKNRIKVLTGHNRLADYRHFLLHLNQWQPYALKESEEMIAARKDLTGRSAFVALFEELTGSLSISVTMHGEEHHLKTDEVLALLHRPDPAPRAKAFDALLQALASQRIFFKNIMNALVMDHYHDSQQRGHPFPMHKSLLSNGVDEAMIEGMMHRVETHYPMARRYFQLKARLLGLDRITYTDQFVPQGTGAEGMAFSEARDILLDAMAAFHPLFYSAAKEFFDKRRIDAEVRKGKMDGAFCESFAPSLPPYISMNYSGHLRDLMVLTHEIGHGIHFVFSRGQTYLNYAPPPLLSETAATFCEMIVAAHLLGKKDFQSYRKNLLACHIEGIITTVFRQTVLTRFEQAIHTLRQDRLLSEEEICQCWWDENQRFYGEDVALPPLYRWGWACVPHFFRRHFYCYNYIFGNLFAILLFQKCREQEGFLEDVIRLFSQGGSEGPLEMFRDLGFDFAEEALWEKSFAYVESLIESLEGWDEGTRNH